RNMPANCAIEPKPLRLCAAGSQIKGQKAATVAELSQRCKRWAMAAQLATPACGEREDHGIINQTAATAAAAVRQLTLARMVTLWRVLKATNFWLAAAWRPSDREVAWPPRRREPSTVFCPTRQRRSWDSPNSRNGILARIAPPVNQF